MKPFAKGYKHAAYSGKCPYARIACFAQPCVLVWKLAKLSLYKGIFVAGDKMGRIRDDNAAEYNKNPRRCEYCDSILPYRKRMNRFCNSSCSASHNNVGRIRNPTGLNGKMGKRVKRAKRTNDRKSQRRKRCLFCDTILSGAQKKYCSLECHRNHKWKQKRDRIEEAGFIPDTQRKTGKKYLAEVRGYRCEMCGISEWNGEHLVLVLDHIDGHSENGKLENLRLICPNCDSQLPTYKGANRGNGRKDRYG